MAYLVCNTLSRFHMSIVQSHPETKVQQPTCNDLNLRAESFLREFSAVGASLSLSLSIPLLRIRWHISIHPSIFLAVSVNPQKKQVVVFQQNLSSRARRQIFYAQEKASCVLHFI